MHIYASSPFFKMNYPQTLSRSHSQMKIMKGRASNHYSLPVFAFVILLLVFTSASSGNALFAPKSEKGTNGGGDERVKANEINLVKEEDFSKLMGMETEEECNNEDEECIMSRREMAEEAHLDYIYTQKHHLHHP